MRTTPIFVSAFLALGTAAQAQLQAIVETSGLSSPVAYVQDPTNSNQRFAVQQGGAIRTVTNGTIGANAYTFGAGVLSSGSERGLLGMAFHPNHASNGFAYVYYTDAGGNIQVSRLTRSGNTFGSLTPVINIARNPARTNHNGGTIRFGPDGMMYLGLGDGGGGNDPDRNAQNPNTLLGKMVRIDVNGDDFGGDPNRNYAIPNSNPFFGTNGPVQALDEIWAFGVRNPFKFSFDSANGALVIADVGQSAREEINYAANGVGGQNYGWVKWEGTLLNSTVPTGENLAYEPHTPPIFEYERTVGRSITGGFVYRGSALGAFYQGRYFFADYVDRKLFSVALSPSGGTAIASDFRDHTAEIGGSAFLGNVSSIDVDQNGELFITNLGGTVYRLRAVPEPGTLLALAGLGSLVIARSRRRRR